MKRVTVKEAEQILVKLDQEFNQLDMARVKATEDGDWEKIQEIDGQMDPLKEKIEQLRGMIAKATGREFD